MVLTDDAGIRELNRYHRGVDRPTDVLSFSQSEGDAQLPDGRVGAVDASRDLGAPGASDATRNPGAPGSGPPRPALGDIVISLPTAARQATATGRRALRAELAALLVHGLLHLLGHDHADPPRDSEPMLDLQERLLEQLQRDEITQQTRREMVRLSEG